MRLSGHTPVWQSEPLKFTSGLLENTKMGFNVQKQTVSATYFILGGFIFWEMSNDDTKKKMH